MRSKYLLVALIFLFTTRHSWAQKWIEMNASKAQSMEWYKEAKFGMLVHFGLYSVPGGIWKGHRIEEYGRQQIAEWIQYSAQIPRAEYRQLMEQFNPVRFDAEEIASLAVEAGMRYLLITAKHHDGFALWDSKVSDFDVMNTPFKRDIVGELNDACKKYGLKLCVYYSHCIDWMDAGDCNYQWFNDYYKGVWPLEGRSKYSGQKITTLGANLWDPGPNTFDEYLVDKAYPQVKELVTSYPDLGLIWFDMARYMTNEVSLKFYQLCYKYQPGMLVNERIGNGYGDYGVTGDNSIPREDDEYYRNIAWESVGTMNNSWGYKSYDNDWKSTYELLYWIFEIASKGGNYLLNVGPGPDGSLPKENIDRLRAIGKWMKVNGEAIYGTRRWKVTREGPSVVPSMGGTEGRKNTGFTSRFTPGDFWFTSKSDKVYALTLEKPKDNVILIRSLANEKISEVRLLGHEGPLKWELKQDCLKVFLPGKFIAENGYVIEVSINNK